MLHRRRDRPRPRPLAHHRLNPAQSTFASGFSATPSTIFLTQTRIGPVRRVGRGSGRIRSMSDRVLISLSDGVADVRFNRADKRNALDNAMFQAIADAGEQLKSEAGLRAVVLSGDGPSFCAGLDFSSFQAMAGGDDDAPPAERPARAEGNPGEMKDGRITHLGQQVCWVWQELPVPVIAAVHGHALGGGLQIALGADIRIVHPDTQAVGARGPLGPRARHDRHVHPVAARPSRRGQGAHVHGARVHRAPRPTNSGWRPGSATTRTTTRWRWPSRSPAAARGRCGAARRCSTVSPTPGAAEQFAAERSVIGAQIGSAEPDRGGQGRLREPAAGVRRRRLTRCRSAPGGGRPVALQFRMFTARAMIITAITSESGRLQEHQHLRPVRDRQRVGRAERGRVGERRGRGSRRTPATSRRATNSGVCISLNTKAGATPVPDGPLGGSTAVEQPVPEAERDDVGHPDRRAGGEQDGAGLVPVVARGSRRSSSTTAAALSRVIATTRTNVIRRSSVDRRSIRPGSPIINTTSSSNSIVGNRNVG